MQILKKEMTFGNVTVNSGELGFGYLTSVELKDCTVVRLPIMVMNGAEDGPKFIVSAAVHGSELTGTNVIRRVMREELDPKKLKGIVVALPIGNPLGFQAGNRNAPQDGSYPRFDRPGDPTGSATERMGGAVWDKITSKMDFRIDIHGNSRPCTAFCLCSLHDSRTRDNNEKIAKATGLTIVYSPPTGTLEGMGGPLSADFEPVSSVTLELIEAGRVTEISTNLGTRAVMNAMKMWGMIEGDIEPQPEEYVWGSGYVQNGGRLKVNRGGIIHFIKKPGEFIKKDEIVAKTYNPFGDLVEEVKFPFDGHIRAWSARHQAVNTGSSIAYITHDK